MNGHSSSQDLFIQNNVLGKTITIKNGTVTGTDGAVGLSDFYNGTVVLENMTVTGRVWTDGHPYIINGGTYAEIINNINANTPGIVTIYDGKFSQLGNWGSGGTFTLYGGKYAVNPSSLGFCTIPSGYSVQSNNDSDSGTYPWVVRNTSSPVANPYSHAVTEVTANRQWTFTMPSYDVEVVANYAPLYLAYNTETGGFDTHSVPDNITVMTSGTTTMNSGWYIVYSNVTISDRITVNGTAHLILCDGKTLTASKGITVNNGNTLNIYGQTSGTGVLYARGTQVNDAGYGGTESAGIGSTGHTTIGNITIHGGRITAIGASWSAGIGGGVNGGGGSVAIYGGTVNATGKDGSSAAIGQASGDGMYYDITLAGRTLYKDGDWNTLCLPFALATLTGTPLEGFTVKTLTSSSFAGGTLTMTFSDDLNSIDAGKPYIVKWDNNADLVINTAADWRTFATNVNNGTESYQGKTVKLAANISISTMVGADGKEFRGTFDGCGHTLTFNYTTTADNAAPFQWIKNATIKNLTVMGEIRSSQMFAAGFVARAYGDNAIENSVSSVTIHATKVGDGTHGGFVGRIESDCKTFTFTNCLFNGTFDGSNTDNWCPFAAWSMGNSNTNFTFNNCLYAPVSANVRNGCATFYRNGTPTLNGAYYTQALGTAQGTNASGMNNETLVSNLGDGWEVRGGNVVPKMVNTVNDVVNPVFTGVTISNATANVETDYVDFVGTYSPTVIYESGDKHNLYLGSGNDIYYPTRTGYEVKSCRAYFQLKNGLTAGTPNAGVRAFVLNFGEGKETGIKTIHNAQCTMHNDAGAWHSLDGRKLDGKPTQRGVYVNNGRKVVIK